MVQAATIAKAQRKGAKSLDVSDCRLKARGALVEYCVLIVRARIAWCVPEQVLPHEILADKNSPISKLYISGNSIESCVVLGGACAFVFCRVFVCRLPVGINRLSALTSIFAANNRIAIVPSDLGG